MPKFCWLCKHELYVADDFIGDCLCPNLLCQVQNSFYDPEDHEPIPEEDNLENV